MEIVVEDMLTGLVAFRDAHELGGIGAQQVVQGIPPRAGRPAPPSGSPLRSKKDRW
jgi:hypothetical protein